MATLYVDLENGNDANDGLSFANRKKTITSASSSASAGDVVRIMASGTPTSIGSASWTNLSPTVTVAAGLTQLLYDDGAWTGGASVTSTATTARRLGATAASLVPAAGFTTGKIGYYDLGSTQDLSAFDAISFYIRITTAQTDLSIYNISLCSDASGNTVVHTLTFPATNSITNVWFPLTLSDGTSLPSNVRSIALYATTDPVTPTIVIDNVIACNKTGLNMTALLSKDADGVDSWAIKSISGTIVTLDTGMQSLATVTPRGYVGTTESVTTYATNPIEVIGTGVTSATADFFTINTSGTSGSEITYSGGWNRTDMTTQTGFTWISGIHGGGEIIGIASKEHLRFEKIGGCRANKVMSVSATSTNIGLTSCCSAHVNGEGFLFSGASVTSCFMTSCISKQSAGVAYSFATGALHTVTDCYATNALTDGFSISANVCTLTDCTSVNNGSDGFFLSTADGTVIEGGVANDNGAAGYNFGTATQNRLVSCEARRNFLGASMSQSMMNYFIDFITEDNTTASLDSNTSSNAENYFYNWTHNEATTVATPVNYENAKFISIKDNGTDTNHQIYTDNGLISSDTTTRHTASGISWKIQPTSSIRQAGYPLTHRIPAVLCKANIEHTASVWLRRTNTGITGNFVLRRGQLSGLSTTITETMTAAADTWEQLSIVFTPTADGYVEFEVEGYGGSTHTLYWDDFSISASEYLDGSSGDYAFIRTGVLIGDDGATGGGGGETSHTFFG